MAPRHEKGIALRFVERLLASVQSALRRRAAGAAALWATAGAFVFLAILLVADAAIGFPGGARPVIYLAAWVAGIVAVAAAVGGAWMKVPSTLYLARLIELQRPELKNALLTFVELQRDPLADRTLAAALARRTARLLADAEPRMFLPPSALRRPAMAAACAALLLGVGAWFAQGILFTPWVTAAEAGFVRDGAEPPMGVPGPVSAGRDENSQDANHAGGVPTVYPPVGGPLLRGHVSRDGHSMPSERRAGHATRLGMGDGADGRVPRPASSRHAEPGASGGAPRDLAGSLKADAATFERLAAALASDAAASPGNGAAGPGAPREQGASRGTPPTTSDDRAPRPVLSGREGGPQGTPETGGMPTVYPPVGGPPLRGHGTREGDNTPSERRAGHAARPNMQGGDSGAQGAAAPPAPTGGKIGQGGGGTAESAGRASAGEPVLPRRTPSEEFPPEVLDSMRARERIIKKAEERLREGDVTGAFLERMGMNNAEFRRFVTSWQRKFEASAHGPEGVPLPPSADAPAGEGHGEILRPVQDPATSPARGEVTRGSDGSKGLVQGSEARVSPRLRPAVAGYFDAIGRMGGAGGQEGEAK
jgi:hypothetical protein